MRNLGILLIGSFVTHRLSSTYVAHLRYNVHPITHVSRVCPQPTYPTLQGDDRSNTPTPTSIHPSQICLTTLTDERHKSWAVRVLGWRNFDGLLQSTWSNKEHYASKHGYRLFDESDRVDTSRPPSWSKIIATHRLLTHEDCEWVVWLDADTIIMNSEIAIEEFLPCSQGHDLLVTRDDGGGYNAGAWVMRKSDWSIQFLESWWGLKSYVKPPGLSKSGDNDALKHLLSTLPDLEDHVLVPPRCTFNSFARAVWPAHYATAQRKLTTSPWYQHEGYYHQGDFIAHVAGYDNKKDLVLQFLELAV
jgi:mannan polymerase II complex MNN10 subunit